MSPTAKTQATSYPVAALPDGSQTPAEEDLAHVLGPANEALHHFVHRLQTAHPDVVPTWKFSTVVGWHQIYLRGKRRIFYLVPERGDFRLSLIIGGKAIDALLHGPCADQVRALVTHAKRYPEGTLFLFRHENFDPQIVAAMLEAKIAS